jgi:hypothetical protein
MKASEFFMWCWVWQGRSHWRSPTYQEDYYSYSASEITRPSTPSRGHIHNRKISQGGYYTLLAGFSMRTEHGWQSLRERGDMRHPKIFNMGHASPINLSKLCTKVKCSITNNGM